MIITVWLHMLRVFMTGSYKPPREFNWAVGVILMLLTLLLSFTGYLLPWDQLAIWAITVGSNMARATPFLGHEGPGAAFLQLGDIGLVHAGNDARFALLGGRFVGEGALLRFYVLHCLLIPFVAAILMAVHFWRVRKDGGISGPMGRKSNAPQSNLLYPKVTFSSDKGDYGSPERVDQLGAHAPVFPAVVRRVVLPGTAHKMGLDKQDRSGRTGHFGGVLSGELSRSQFQNHRNQGRQYPHCDVAFSCGLFCLAVD